LLLIASVKFVLYAKCELSLTLLIGCSFKPTDVFYARLSKQGFEPFTHVGSWYKATGKARYLV
jgi:hypothetical protein